MKNPLRKLVDFAPLPRVHPYRVLVLLSPLAALCSIALASFGIGLPWAVDLATHWIWPALFALTALGMVGSLKERTFSLVGVLLCLVLIIGEGHTSPKVPGAGIAFKLASFNVESSNQNFSAFHSWLREGSPDVVAVLEVSSAWAKDLKTLTGYPYQKLIERDDNFGIALISKYPFEVADADAMTPAYDYPPSVSAVITVPHAGPIKVVATHPLPPGNPEGHDKRAAQLAYFGNIVARYPGAAVLAGDLNASPWSSPYLLLKKSGLTHVSGAQPTWPAKGLPLELIPIDHVFVNKFVEGVSSSVGGRLGSDHLPVLVTLRIPAAQ